MSLKYLSYDPNYDMDEDMDEDTDNDMDEDDKCGLLATPWHALLLLFPSAVSSTRSL